MKQYTIGVPRERKEKEGRVSLTPSCVSELVSAYPHAEVLVESHAGELAGFSDEEYRNAGASLVDDPVELYLRAHLIVKVKEPIPEEYPFLAYMQGKTLFTYLHLAGVDRELTRTLLRNRITAVAYENVEVAVEGRRVFPLLVPMSRIAGTQSMRMANERYLTRGKGKASVVIIGGGVVGEAALVEAIAQKVASVVVYEPNEIRRLELQERYGQRRIGKTRVCVMDITEMRSTRSKVPPLATANIVISGVMNPGGSAAPKVLTHAEFAMMPLGAIVVDVAIDQGGSTEWSRPTLQGETYEREGIIFSCTANIPGSVPREATIALTEATFSYVKLFAEYGKEHPHESSWWALKEHEDLRKGLQSWKGKLTNQFVASKHKLFREYQSMDTLF